MREAHPRRFRSQLRDQPVHREAEAGGGIHEQVEQGWLNEKPVMTLVKCNSIESSII